MAPQILNSPFPPENAAEVLLQAIAYAPVHAKGELETRSPRSR